MSYGGDYGDQDRQSYVPARAAWRAVGQQPHVQEHQGPQQHSYDGYDSQPSQDQQYGHPPPPVPNHQQSRMGDNNYLQKPQVGATFMPSGFDDFYMPEVVSPTPQRIMPEVPSNMQEGLAHLELEARSPQGHRMSSGSTVSSMQSPAFSNQYGQSQRGPGGPGYTASYEHTNASAYQNMGQSQASRNLDSPKFSPFPKLRDPGPNVPLSDEDKEEVLERARPLVLKSQDPEMQLAWAQDALTWCEVAQQCAQRVQAETGSVRPITPRVEHQLREDALNIVTFLAEQFHPKAEFMKGQWLEFGKFNHRVDKKEAFLAYRRAADKGYARAEYRIGMQYENSNNSAKAVDHYQRGVSLRDSASNYRLGMMTLLGQHGMHQDYQHGVDLIRFAAETADENSPQGAYVYGMLLARELPNITVPDQFLGFDLNEAKMFIEKAAYLGFAKAQLKMGQAYELCQLGCEFEPALSLHYNALSARQGEAEAEMAISKWFLCGYDGIFEKNEELAYTYAKRAAVTKLPTAEFAMGYFYEIGMYVPADLHESEIWYQKAAEHGNKDALGRIDSIKKNNTLSKKDHEAVALNRIKSQYGSQRGARPDRFKSKPVPMAAIADIVDMTDPRYNSTGVSPLRPLKGSGPPPRPVSAAPYPEDDMAHGRGNGQYGRPGSSSSTGPAADRPSSAFGIRPLQHASTDSYGQSLDPRANVRPSSTGNQGPVPGRIPAGDYRGPGGVTLPPVDAGRPLNMDQGPGGNTFRKPPPQNTNRPVSANPPYGADSYGRPPQGSYSQAGPPPAGTYTRPDRGSSVQTSMHGPPMQSPMSPMMSPPPISTSSRASNRPPPSQTMSPNQNSSRPGSAAPSTTPSTAPSTGSSAPAPVKKPTKAGPATFEEMGIPVQKNESDCIIM